MNAVVSTTEHKSLIATMANRYGIEPNIMLSTLKATAFRGDVSNAQMAALLIVANQYGLNPWTKEIYAFPDRNNGIVPVVGVDGWARIMNEHPQFDGIDFEQSDESCTCIIYRKDRAHPIRVTEYLAECKRSTTSWESHPRRMLRHKAMIQCARMAFGFVGVYDPDEAERIVEAQAVQVHPIPDVRPATLHDRVRARIGKTVAAAPESAEPESQTKPVSVDPDTGEVLPEDFQ